ncbi:MAG: hypothetical protein AB8F78_18170 [Saprospiraceae bacterium]
MKTELERHEYIDRFHAGEINADEFELQLAAHSELRSDYESYKKDIQVIRSSVKNQLKTQAGIHLAGHKEKPARLTVLKRALQIAALLLVTIGGLYLFTNDQPQTGSQLFAAHFELPEQANVRANTNRIASWEEAMNSYAAKDYEGTIQLLSSAIDQKDSPYQDRVHLYLGLSQLMENEELQAITSFEKVRPESSYIHDAEWFTAMAYLKVEDMEKAKVALSKIAAKPRHFKHKEVLAILDRLN